MVRERAATAHSREKVMTFTFTDDNSISDGGALFTVSDTIVVTQGAFVENHTSGLSSFDQALELNTGSYVVTIAGVVGTTISSSGSAIGIDFFDAQGQSKLTVTATGHVYGATAGVYCGHLTNVVNAGVIDGGVTGIRVGNTQGDFKIVNKGEIHAGNFAIDLFSVSGTHTIVNSGHLFGGIGGFSAIERVSNGGEIDGINNLLAGNDVFVNMLKVGHKIHHGLVLGEILMGDGNDIFVGGKFHESVSDEGGKDKYKLGAGDDDFHAAGEAGAGDAFTDTVDGGAGVDWYNASGATVNLKINLDSKSHVDPLLSYTHAANLATDVGAGDIGNDKVTNFENVDGGSGADSIFGNAAANQIDGDGGGDNLFGLGGNDTLNGGSGQDDLFGGTGADQLNAGGADGVLDRFRYTSLKDSLPSAPDTIIGFEDGKDLIDLTGLNIATIGLIGIDQEFPSNSPGDVRVLTTLSGWLIQVDAGTDGVTDLAIKVEDASHNIAWDSNDFAF